MDHFPVFSFICDDTPIVYFPIYFFIYAYFAFFSRIY